VQQVRLDQQHPEEAGPVAVQKGHCLVQPVRLDQPHPEEPVRVVRM